MAERLPIPIPGERTQNFFAAARDAAARVVDRFNPRPYFDSVKNFLLTDTSQILEPGQLYAWGGKQEKERLELQNGPDGLWGKAHLRHHQELSKKGVAPKEIISVGVGADATLIKNLLVAYPDAERIVVVEQDGEKVREATERLQADVPDLADKVVIEKADAKEHDVGQNLSSDSGQRLLDIQLLFVHLDPDSMGQVLTKMTSVLRPGDHAVVADMMLNEWEVRPKAGKENNPRAQRVAEVMNMFIAGDPTYHPRENSRVFGGLRKLGFWNRGAGMWNTPQDLDNVVNLSSGGKLVAHADEAMHSTVGETIADGKNAMTAVSAYMGSAGLASMIAAQRRFQVQNPPVAEILEKHTIPQLIDLALARMKGHATGLVDERLPTMHWRTYTVQEQQAA